MDQNDKGHFLADVRAYAAQQVAERVAQLGIEDPAEIAAMLREYESEIAQAWHIQAALDRVAREVWQRAHPGEAAPIWAPPLANVDTSFTRRADARAAQQRHTAELRRQLAEGKDA